MVCMTMTLTADSVRSYQIYKNKIYQNMSYQHSFRSQVIPVSVTFRALFGPWSFPFRSRFTVVAKKNIVATRKHVTLAVSRGIVVLIQNLVTVPDSLSLFHIYCHGYIEHSCIPRCPFAKSFLRPNAFIRTRIDCRSKEVWMRNFRLTEFFQNESE